MAVFVGRERELAQLRRRLGEADAGRGRAIFITGEPGAGKSSLVARVLEEASTLAPTFRFISATCSEQYGAGEPYQPFVDAFRSLVGTEERSASKWQSLREIAGEVAPHWVAAIPVAGGVLSATMSTAAELRRGGTAVAAPNEEAIFFQYTELFFAAAAQTPIVLFLDDLHWADRASVALLTHLARRIGDERVLILGTYRPADVDLARHPIREARLELERYGVAEELALAPLDSSALRQIVAEELGAPPSHELLAWLEQHAGSNPLFFGELLRWLVDQGFAKESYGAWILETPPDTLEVPRTAESAIERRLDRLDPEVLRILEYASVEGNEFGSTTLAQLLGMDELALEEAIEPLVRLHRLVRMVDTRELPSGDLSTIYHFGHSLIQDVLHRSLVGKRRILLHRRMAEILERLYAGQDTIAHRLAVHFDEGREPARAFEFGLLGAARASAVFAHLEAIELIRRALRNAQTDAQRAAAFERLGDSLRLAGRHVEARDALRRALEHAGAMNDPETMIRLRRMLIVVERSHGSRPRADLEKELVALSAACRDAGARSELCEVVWLLNGLYDSGSSPAAVERARDALAVCDELDDRALLAKANYNLGRTLASGGEPATALPHLRDALDLFEAMENRYAAGNCRNLLGILLILGGDYKAGAAEFDTAARIFDTLGDPGSEAHVRSNLGALLTRLGRWEEAEENLREAIRLDLRMGASAWLLSPLENLARLHQARDDWPAALEEWQALLTKAKSTGYADVQALACAALGLCALEQGDAAAAAAHEQDARALLQSQADWSDGRTEHSILAARLAAADGQDETAVAMLRVAEDALQPRDPWLWANVRLLRGEIRAKSSPGEAAALVREALGTFENLGAEPLVQRATATLLTLGGA